MEQRATLALVLALFAALGSASAQAAPGSPAAPPAAAADAPVTGQPAQAAPPAESPAAGPAAGSRTRGFAPAAIRYELGVVAALNLDSGTGTASLVTNILGASLSFPLAPASRLSFEPGADLYWAYYGEVADRAVPIELENRDAFVLALLLDAPLSYAIPLSEDFRLSLGAGLAFDLRVGIKAAEEVADETVAAINSYLWSKGRFLMPSTFLRIEYRLTENFDFGFAARAFWPLYNLWAGEGLPLLDQGIFGGSLVVRQRLR
ncbi:MAG TPA: hypothetical protein P5165_02340 [Spirochaetia bacterium]|nr:hypothetical protein [Spirochaetia bacterium]